jgi:hypothetical protein
LPPLTRSADARQVRVTTLRGATLALAATDKAFSLAGIEVTLSGSASGKLMVAVPPPPNSNFKELPTVAFTVKPAVVLAAIASTTKSIIAANIRAKIFRIFILLASLLLGIRVKFP